MPTVSRLSYRSRILMAAFVATGLFVPSIAKAQAVPAVFQQAPVKADAYLVIPKLSGLSQKLAIINESLNLGQAPLADAMSEFKRQFGIAGGLNEDGSFLIVFMKGFPVRGAATSEKDTLILVPVNDYAAFVGGYKGSANELVTALTLPNERRGFARRVGSYALIGADKRTLEEYKPSDISSGLAALAGPLGLKCIGDSDISIISIGKGARSTDAAAAPSGEILSAVNPDQTISIVGVDISELGIGLSSVAKYKDGSTTGKYFTAGQPAAKYLSKLPSDPTYLTGSALSFQGIDVVAILKAQADLLFKAGSPNTDITRRSISMLESLKGVAVLLSPVGQGGFNGNLFNGTIVIETPNPKAYVASIKEYLESLKTASVLLNAADASGGDANSLKFSTRYTSNALQVDGVSVDQFEVNYIIPSATLKQLADMQLLGLGAGGQNGYIAATGTNVIITTTADAQLVRQGLNSVKASAGLGTSPLISQVRLFLPPSPVIETFVSGSTVINGINFARAMSKQLPPVEIPANLPPVGMGVAVEQGGWMAKVFVPMPLALEIYNGVLPLAIPGATPAASSGNSTSAMPMRRQVPNQNDPNPSPSPQMMPPPPGAPLIGPGGPPR